MDDNQEPSYVNPISELSLDWMFDKFSEPRTMPADWDLSGLLTTTETRRNGHSNQPEEVLFVPTPNRDPQGVNTEDGQAWEVLPVWHRDPFPEPRTYPVYWDLCW